MGEVKDKVARGVAKECFATHLLREQEGLGMSDLEIAYTAGSPFGAGVETVRIPYSPCLFPLGENSLLLTRGLKVRRLSRELHPRLRKVWPAVHSQSPRGA